MVLLLAACTNSRQTRAPASPETPASTSPAGSGPIDLSSLNGRIAFSAGPGRAEDIYVVKADGTGLRQVTSDPAADFDPTQSPDGKQIAYRHQIGDDRSTDIYVVDADGSGERNVSRNEGVADWGPTWSPDGTRILFSSVRDNCSVSDAPDCKTTGDIGPYHTLYVMNADGSAQVRLTDAFGQIADWSLDGQYVVFEDLEGRDGLSLIRSDGSGLTTLPLDLSSPGFPDWIP
jgi:Tol biopolymer transport system component